VKFLKLWLRLANVIGGNRTVNAVVVDNGAIDVVWLFINDVSFEQRNLLVYVNPLTTQALNAERNKFISAISYLIWMMNRIYQYEELVPFVCGIIITLNIRYCS
jgi:hypothetical protein